MKPISTVTLSVLLLPSPLSGLQAAEPYKPNILHIHADDHRPDGLRALGNPLLQTPNLDSLVERGMTFTHCYTMGSMSGAVCAPSRAMLLTGRSWRRIPREPAAAANASDPSTFLPRVMAAAGYQTWHMGKAGEVNAFGTGLKHFETTIADEGKGGERAGNSRRLADKTIEFLKARDTGGEKRPFYAYLAPPVPHDPRTAEPQFHKLYDPAKIPLSPAFMPQHPFDNGEMTVRDERLAPWPRTPENTRQQLADYYACITGFDHHIGRIFEQLKESGQWDNTIVIFSGDNGLSLGEHGLFGKQNLYEFGGMHVPLVVAGPGIAKGKSEAFVYLMDLFPTFAEFAGAKIPDGVEGKSIAPVLAGKQTKVRDALYTAYRDCQRAIRDDRWKLIRYPLVDRTQLFDLSSDPHELVNLADKPEHAAKIAELTALLTKEMASYADTAPLKVAKPKPAEWTPPAPAPVAAPAPAPAAAGQPTGKIRKDSNLHFTRWDSNKDDYVTLVEFQLGQKNRKGLEATFKSYDTNGDGKLSREEYVDPRVLPAPGRIQAAEIHVRPDGLIRTLAEAQRESRKSKATVVVHAGTYYLPEALVFTSEDSGTEYRAADGEKAIISGGKRLDLKWEPYKDGIMQARTPSGLAIDQLFFNGQRQMMARYPNFDANVRPYGGYAADAFSRERATRWADPVGGYIHAMHRSHWGGYHYRITGKDAKGEVTYEGGWQNNRQMGMHKEHRFVENILEELDAPGEWFHNAKTGTLYYYPPTGVDVKTASIEVVRLSHLVEFNGARNVTLRGFVIRHAARTFMDAKEPLLRSDWTIYRGGAVLFNRSEDCTVADCELDQLGGNGIFVNGRNRRIRIVGCDIHDTGASAVAFVGDPKSVRNPLFEYKERQDYAAIDMTPGPKTEDYPADCVVEDCLIRHVGVVEKQATGVQISMAMGITLRHCSIYDASRAGINVSEGTFGGHLIEFCDVFDTVRETGDHGSFNSWGRDRFWGLKNSPTEEMPKLALLDAVKTTVIRNSRWRCDHGWDVDLDDGSSNYEIYNNLFLNGGLKLREGFHRRVRNNIAVNNTLHPHVWYEDSGDIVTNNIWMGAYLPARMNADLKKWGQAVDCNLFTTTDADRMKFAKNGCDANSLVGDPQFVNAAQGDFRVRDSSPALKLGFKNFPMDRFGVTSPRLKAMARAPEIPALKSGTTESRAARTVWLGATVKELEGEEYSAFGTAKEDGGIQLLEVPTGSPPAKAGLRAGDLIQGVNGKPVRTCHDLVATVKTTGDKPVTIITIRNQAKQQTTLTP